MTKLKGQHFAFLTILCCAWSVTRFAFIWSQSDGIERNDVLSVASEDSVNSPEPLSHIDIKLMVALRPFCCGQPFRFNLADLGQAAAHYRPSIQYNFSKNYTVPVTSNVYSGPAKAIIPDDKPNLDEAVGSMAIGKKLPRNTGRTLHAETYAFSYWRWGGTENGLAAGGQYGGGQSGIITTFALQNPDSFGQPQRLAILVRAAIAHDRLDQRELALGVRWRPVKELPVSITAERRLRHDQRDAFAVYAAGGVDDMQLPLQLRMAGFAQAGVVSGKDAGAFFDVLARADRNIVRLKGISLHAGAGAWAGGQRDATRVDIGPSLRTDIVIKTARFRLNADWRFRIAGNASPTNGPALTLSTSF